MSGSWRIAVVGASGFVGRAVCTELSRQGWSIAPVHAPRLRSAAGDLTQVEAAAAALEEQCCDLVSQLRGSDAVVNAAGLAAPASRDRPALIGANSVLACLLVRACQGAKVARFVHLSTAAVQGDHTPLDETTYYSVETAYAESKMLGEQGVLAMSSRETPPRVVVLRATSVHGADRPTTRALVRAARSPAITVMAPGTAPTPQVLVANVAAVVAHLCQENVAPPPIVLQPWEGWTTSDFLRMVSGRRPRSIPRVIGEPLLRLATTVGRGSALVAHRRRLEILWRGQAQVVGWLGMTGFVVPYSRQDWELMVDAARSPRAE